MKKRQSGVMTEREINRGLNKIYKEQDSWLAINRQLNYKIPENKNERENSLSHFKRQLLVRRLDQGNFFIQRIEKISKSFKVICRIVGEGIDFYSFAL